MPLMARVLIAGCGDVGVRLGLRLAADGHEVWGLRRNVSSLPHGIRPVEADVRAPATLRLPAEIDYLFYLPSAGARSDDAYRRIYVDGVLNVLQTLRARQHPVRRVFYVSSTGVYDQHDGAWVDENSPANPAGFTGRRLLEGEHGARSAGFACTVVRFAGIYGPGRSWLVRRVQAGEPCVAEPPLYTNRIHSEDCAAVLHHLMNHIQPADLYLGVDEEPAPQCMVMTWIAQQLGIPAPRPISARGGDGKPPGNKRCANRLLRDTGFRFRYPSFREGYEDILKALLADEKPR